MSEKVYFPNLNGVRFLAALLVIIHHVEQMKFMFAINPSRWQSSPFITVIGKLGVVLFFVLSGFLITYLLLVEKGKFGKVDVKKFYLRRILRIWPLYYFIVFVGFSIIPLISFFDIPEWSSGFSVEILPKLLLFILFLPNVARVLYAPVPYVAQTWSIGVEEQFYLVWPAVVTYSKNIFKVLIIIIVVYFIIKYGLIIGAVSNKSLLPVVRFWNSFNINCMAIGGLGACLVFYKKHNILKVIYHPFFQLSTYFVVGVFLLLGVEIPIFHFETYAVLFIIVILNAATNPKTLIKLDNPFFDYLGKVSFGLYMYHYLAIVLVINVVSRTWFYNDFVLYVFVITLTVVFASLSYYFFEVKFLRLKERFSRIHGGSDNKLL